MSEETKRCPFCGEEILAVAKKIIFMKKNLIGSNFIYKDKELNIVFNSAFYYLLKFDFLKKSGHEETVLTCSHKTCLRVLLQDFIFCKNSSHSAHRSLELQKGASHLTRYKD